MSKLLLLERGVPVPSLSVPPQLLAQQAVWQGEPRSWAEAHKDDFHALQREYVYDPKFGYYRKDRAKLLLQHQSRPSESVQQQVLAYLRDHLHRDIPKHWYRLVLGHDLHIATYGELYMQQYHAHWVDPFTGQLGWWENIGRASDRKVTVAFRDFEVDQLQAATSAYGTYKYHETGLSATAEANTDTALITTTGIARVAGTQTEVAADQYRSVATVTADTAETWQEHGLFNASTGVTLMDRSVLSPTAPVNPSDTVQFTYTLTKNAEA